MKGTDLVKLLEGVGGIILWYDSPNCKLHTETRVSGITEEDGDIRLELNDSDDFLEIHPESVKVVDCGDYSEVVIEDTPFAKIGFDVLSVYFS